MEDIYVSYIREQLHAVLGIDSPSGCTEDVQQYLCDTLRAMGFAPRRLVKGGAAVFCLFFKKPPPWPVTVF